MNKTIRQHLETLPEPYRTQALENASPTMLDRKVDNQNEALRMAFRWAKSPEDFKYWDKFSETLLP